MLEDLRWELVEVSAVPAIQASAETREDEGVVPDRADPVLGLPEPPALDRSSGVEHVVNGEAEELLSVRRFGLCFLERLAEHELEARTAGTELRCSYERQVKL